MKSKAVKEFEKQDKQRQKEKKKQSKDLWSVPEKSIKGALDY